MPESSLRITEVFYSLQGEARSTGMPTVFVRLTGCPLRCHYCDSAYAFYGGERRSFSSLLDEVASYQPAYVCVTGGEPLAQPEVLPFLSVLCDAGYHVSLETSGAMDIREVDERVSIVLDLKTPASGESSRNLYENISLLKAKDQLKFVICDRGDYEWSKFKVDELDLERRVGDVWFSPSFEQLAARDLAEWILEDRLHVRMQLQLHKQLWGDKAGV